jgi:hypothetical protein
MKYKSENEGSITELQPEFEEIKETDVAQQPAAQLSEAQQPGGRRKKSKRKTRKHKRKTRKHKKQSRKRI